MRVIFLILVILSKVSLAQWQPDTKRDYQWVFGTHYTYLNPHGHKLSFLENPPISESFDHDLNIYCTTASICDQEGNLLFFTNGMHVADRLGRIMPNGDSINQGYAWYHWNSQNLGYKVPQDVLILPQFGSDSLFTIFHVKVEIPFTSQVIWYGSRLLQTNIDMTKNEGFGDVLIKNNPIIIDTIAVGMIDACRHANGRDWWILVLEGFTNSFYRYLYSPKGIELVGKQSIGNVHDVNICGHAKFSPDGNKYSIVATGRNLSMNTIYLFDFDRCTGLLSNFRDYSHVSSWYWGFSYSPNSRFLYFGPGDTLYQFDLTKADSAEAFKIVGVYDGFIYHYSNGGGAGTYFEFSQLGPDGKIYLSTMLTPFMAVIEYPDSLGVACHLNQHSLLLNNFIDESIPNFPNFRLGRLEGSACDTLGIYWGVEDQKLKPPPVRVFPNPASSEAIFDLALFNNSKISKIILYNTYGQVVDEILVSPFQSIIKYNTTYLYDGIYYGSLTVEGQPASNFKFIVAH